MKMRIYSQILMIMLAYNFIAASIETPTTSEISQTPLIQAVLDKNISKVKLLISQAKASKLLGTHSNDVRINAQDSKGNTALMWAAIVDSFEIFKLLLCVEDIDIYSKDKDGLTALDLAIINGNKEIVQALLDASILHRLFTPFYSTEATKNESGLASFDGQDKERSHDVLEQRDKKLQFTPLARAARSGQSEIIRLLLSAGANPTAIITTEDKNLAVSQLYKQEDKETTELLANKAKEFTERSLEVISYLSNKKLDEANKLIAKGIDVNAKDKDGNTLLYLPVYYDHKDIVTQLINNKADLNVRVKGYTILQLALDWNRINIAELLINNKADVNAKVQDGWTPLHRAVCNGYKDIVQLLINNRADVNAKYKNLHTPLYYAAWLGSRYDSVSAQVRFDTERLLKKAGAKGGRDLCIIS